MLPLALTAALWRYMARKVDFIQFQSPQDDRQQDSYGAEEAS